MQDGYPTSSGEAFANAVAALAAITVLAALDVASDLAQGASFRHVLIESVMFLVALGGTVLLGRRIVRLRRASRAAEREVRALTDELSRSKLEATRWREEASDLVTGLASAIDRQFERWALTPAEKEVAMLLLKGLSHKEVAQARSITEATARQQARAVYKKAGVTGRSDLSAFFLEDLLLPGGPHPHRL